MINTYISVQPELIGFGKSPADALFSFTFFRALHNQYN